MKVQKRPRKARPEKKRPLITGKPKDRSKATPKPAHVAEPRPTPPRKRTPEELEEDILFAEERNQQITDGVKKRKD